MRKTISIKDYFTATATVGTFGSHSMDCTVKMIASYVYNPNTGIITGYSSPELSLESYEPTEDSDNLYIKASLNNISTNTKIASNKYSIDFSATYDISGSYRDWWGVVWAKNKYISMTGVPE